MYVIIQFDNYYPAGGEGDFVGNPFLTLDEAVVAAEAEIKNRRSGYSFDNFYIVRLEVNEDPVTVWERDQGLISATCNAPSNHV